MKAAPFIVVFFTPLIGKPEISGFRWNSNVKFLLSMHRLRRVDLVLAALDEQDDRDAAQEHDPEIQENIHIRQHRALFHQRIIERLIGLAQSFIGRESLGHEPLLQLVHAVLHLEPVHVEVRIEVHAVFLAETGNESRNDRNPKRTAQLAHHSRKRSAFADVFPF